MIQAPAVYVASPLGFSVPTRMYYEKELLARLAAAGFTILDPWEGVAEAAAGPPDVMPIGARNAAMIDRAAGVLAVLDGPDVDSGTAAEIGYAAARGIRVVGLRTDIRQSGEEGAVVNLQVEYFVRVSGGTIAGSLEEAVAALAGLVRRG